jgi:hypothetical protein
MGALNTNCVLVLRIRGAAQRQVWRGNPDIGGERKRKWDVAEWKNVVNISEFIRKVKTQVTL